MSIIYDSNTYVHPYKSIIVEYIRYVVCQLKGLN